MIDGVEAAAGPHAHTGAERAALCVALGSGVQAVNHTTASGLCSCKSGCHSSLQFMAMVLKAQGYALSVIHGNMDQGLFAALDPECTA